MDKRGKFIVIDGMDGSGKGTQITLLKERLTGQEVLFTREPGGSPKAEEIREMILRTNGPDSNAICDFFLFWAARGSHIEDVVEPARNAGTHVLCDRYDSSTYAFQIFGEEHSELYNLFTVVRANLDAKKYYPDLYIFLDLPPEVAYERRMRDASQEKSKFDIKPLAYHERVREGFMRFAREDTSSFRVHIVDAKKTPSEIHEEIYKVVREEFAT